MDNICYDRSICIHRTEGTECVEKVCVVHTHRHSTVGLDATTRKRINRERKKERRYSANRFVCEVYVSDWLYVSVFFSQRMMASLNPKKNLEIKSQERKKGRNNPRRARRRAGHFAGRFVSHTHGGGVHTLYHRFYLILSFFLSFLLFRSLWLYIFLFLLLGCCCSTWLCLPACIIMRLLLLVSLGGFILVGLNCLTGR